MVVLRRIVINCVDHPIPFWPINLISAVGRVSAQFVVWLSCRHFQIVLLEVKTLHVRVKDLSVRNACFLRGVSGQSVHVL